jgi:hypothetical protein
MKKELLPTWKELVIAECAKMLGSREQTIRSEAANIPLNHDCFNEKNSIKDAAKIMYFNILQTRQAEYDFFRSHPELNP